MSNIETRIAALEAKLLPPPPEALPTFQIFFVSPKTGAATSAIKSGVGRFHPIEGETDQQFRERVSATEVPKLNSGE